MLAMVAQGMCQEKMSSIWKEAAAQTKLCGGAGGTDARRQNRRLRVAGVGRFSD